MIDKQLTIEEKIQKIEGSESFEELKTGWFPQSASTSYYFVSYCHKDYKKVFIDILGMQGCDSEIAVWYDRELNVGRDWEKEAKTHIYDFDCLGVIFYISENSVESSAVLKEMQMVADAGKPFIPIVLPVENIRKDAGKYLSGAALLDKLYPHLPKDDEKYKLYHEMFGENVTYFKYTDSPQDKTERMKKSFTRLPLLELSGYKRYYPDKTKVLAVNNINVIEVNESDFRFIDENNRPINIWEIGKCAFSNCRQLETVALPTMIEIIGKYAFYNCKKLKTVKLSSDSSLKTVHDSAFRNCENLKNITLPDGIVSIGESAFSGCIGLKNISVPKYVRALEDYTFDGCIGLTSITLPDYLNIIGAGAFDGCSGLTEISIPDSVKSIGNFAFAGCRSLAEISIPDSVKSIGNFAFTGCRSLTDVSLPGSVKSLGDSLFYECGVLSSIVFGGTTEEWRNACKAGAIDYSKYNNGGESMPKYDNSLGITHEVTVICADGKMTIGKPA